MQPRDTTKKTAKAKNCRGRNVEETLPSARLNKENGWRETKKEGGKG